jgi:hypothetical protein
MPDVRYWMSVLTSLYWCKIGWPVLLMCVMVVQIAHLSIVMCMGDCSGVWIGYWVCWTLKTCNYNYRSSLWIYTVSSSLWHALSLVSLLCLHQSSGNGFQEQTLLPLGSQTHPAPQPQQISANSHTTTTTSRKLTPD